MNISDGWGRLSNPGSVVLALASLLIALPQASGQKAGDTVVVAVDYDTRIRTRIVDKVYAGGLHKVIDSQGKWCALQGIEGWIPKQNCLSIPMAMKQFTQRIESNKGDFDARMTRGMIYLDQGKLQLALRDINEALKLSPKRANFWNNRGLVHMRMNQIEAAISDIGNAIRLAPQFANAFNNRGMCHYARGAFEQAIADYSEAIRINGNSPMYYVNRGVALHSSGKPSEAMDDYNKALSIRRSIPQAFIGRSNVYLGSGDLARARDNASEAIRLNPESPEAYNNRGWIRYKTGDIDGALADFKKSIELDAEFAKAYSNRGVLLTDQGKYDDALVDLNKAVQMDEYSALTFTNRGNAWLGKGEYSKAGEDFNKALDLAEHDAQALNGKAWFLATCSRDEFRDGPMAVELAEQACEASGMRNWSHIDTLAAACAETGDFSRAVTLEKKALELAPDSDKDVCRQRLALYLDEKPFRTDSGQ